MNEDVEAPLYEALRDKIQFLQELRRQDKITLEEKYVYFAEKIQREIDYEVLKSNELYKEIKHDIETLQSSCSLPKKQKTLYKKLQKQITDCQLDSVKTKKNLNSLTSQLQTKSIANSQKIERKMKQFEVETKSLRQKHKDEISKLENQMKEITTASELKVESLAVESVRLKQENESLHVVISNLQKCQERLMQEQQKQTNERLEVLELREKQKQEENEALIETHARKIEDIMKQKIMDKENYETQTESYIRQISNLKEMLDGKSKEISKIKRLEAENMKQQREEFERDLRKQKSRFEADIKAKSEELKILQNRFSVERDKNRGKKSEASLHLSRLKREHERFVELKEKEIKEMGEKVVSSKKELLKTTKRLTNLKRKSFQEKKAYGNELSEERQKIDKIEAEKESIEQDKRELRKEIDKLKETNDNKMKTMNQKNEQIKALDNALKTKEEELCAQEKLLFESKSEIEGLKTKISELEESVKKKKPKKSGKPKRKKYSTFSKTKTTRTLRTPSQKLK